MFISEEYLTESYLSLVDLKPYGFILDYSEVKYFNKQDQRILLNRKAAIALVNAKKELPLKYNFVINSGYRGYDEQVRINEYMKEKLKKQYPNNWEDKLNIYTGGEDYLEYLRTHKGRFSHMSHASGNAVDIVGIVDNNKRSLDLGGQTNTDTDKIDYYEKKRSLSPKEIIIRDNRKMMKLALVKHNFEPFKDEWWHWGYYK